MDIKIISGGQTGVDIAARRAAKKANIPTAWHMPNGFYTAGGFKPESAELYVEAADVTIIIGTDLESSDLRAATKAAWALYKPIRYFLIAPGSHYDLSDPVKRGAASALLAVILLTFAASVNGQCVVNIAGNRDKALEEPVEAFLYDVFCAVKAAAE